MVWNTMREFLLYLDKYENYVILRNFESLLEEGLQVDHSDIDLICDNADKLIAYLDAPPRTAVPDRIHRMIEVAGSPVELDIREIGDGYFDARWEQQVLDRRERHAESFNTMGLEDYFYTLLYHACVHKQEINPEYSDRLILIGTQLDVPVFQLGFRRCLEAYMNKNGYLYTYPAFVDGVFNTRGADKHMIENNPKMKRARILRPLQRIMRRLKGVLIHG